MKVKPLADRILVKRLDNEEENRGGIIIPDSAKEKPLEARVIAIGPGKKNDNGDTIAMSISVGDKILLGKYSGTEVKLNDIEHIIMREDEVLAVIED